MKSAKHAFIYSKGQPRGPSSVPELFFQDG